MPQDELLQKILGRVLRRYAVQEFQRCVRPANRIAATDRSGATWSAGRVRSARCGPLSRRAAAAGLSDALPHESSVAAVHRGGEALNRAWPWGTSSTRWASACWSVAPRGCRGPGTATTSCTCRTSSATSACRRGGSSSEPIKHSSGPPLTSGCHTSPAPAGEGVLLAGASALWRFVRQPLSRGRRSNRRHWWRRGCGG